MKLKVLARKKISDGEAVLRTWFDEGATKKQLWQVVVSTRALTELIPATVLPAEPSSGTREKTQAIFDGLSEQTSYEEVYDRALLEKATIKG